MLWQIPLTVLVSVAGSLVVVWVVSGARSPVAQLSDAPRSTRESERSR